MYVEVKEANKRVYLKHDNGLTAAMSEQYATLWNAKRAAKRMFPDLAKTLVKKNHLHVNL